MGVVESEDGAVVRADFGRWWLLLGSQSLGEESSERESELSEGEKQATQRLGPFSRSCMRRGGKCSCGGDAMRRQFPAAGRPLLLLLISKSAKEAD